MGPTGTESGTEEALLEHKVLEFPIPVRVAVVWGKDQMPAAVLHSTKEVVLLEAQPDLPMPPVGMPVVVEISWDAQKLKGRVAAHGKDGRCLLSIGDRPVRASKRFKVDLPATVRATMAGEPLPARILDLSKSGARLAGYDLPVGADFILAFTPPGIADEVITRAVVVRQIPDTTVPTVGIAFRLAAITGGARPRKVAV